MPRGGNVRPGEPELTRTMATLRRDAVQGGFLIGAVSLASNAASLSVPLYSMQIFNRVMMTHNLRTLSGLSLGVALAVIIYIALDRMRMALMAALAERFARGVAPPLLRAVQATWPHGDDPMQAMRDTETLRVFLGGPSLTAPFDLAWSPILLLALLVMGWEYGAVAALCVLVLAVVNFLGDAAARKHMTEANMAAADNFREIAGAARSAEAVVSMGMLKTLLHRWSSAEAEASAEGVRALLRSRACTAATHALRSAMTGAIVATGLVLVLNGYASSGSMVAANMILARILMPFEQFAGTLRQWSDAAASWRRVRSLLGEAVPSRYSNPLPAPVGRLTVERLVYIPSGAERPILRGISFTVEPGEIVAVIGPSAAGKSTLLRLALGMVEPTSGGAFLDGHSTYLWNREDMARHVGYVPQSLALTDGTIAETIARGAPAPDFAAVLSAAKRAGMHPVIAALPRGYATSVSGGGFMLSAGQRQRLALARALYGNPRFLVLDEPTAFLDSDGEEMLSGLLTRLRAQGVGALVSAHRPSLLRATDKLIVLRDGLIDHFGPTGQVLKQMNGPKVRLVRNAAAAS